MESEQFFDNFLLGVTASRVNIDSRLHNLAAIRRLSATASQSIKILSRTLDPYIYENEAVIDAIVRFCRPNRQTLVKILVFDSSPMVQQGHKLLLMAQKMPSKIEIRQLGKESSWRNESLFLADRSGYLLNPKSDRYEAEVDFCDSNRTHELNSQFGYYWDHSEADSQLRRLTL